MGDLELTWQYPLSEFCFKNVNLNTSGHNSTHHTNLKYVNSLVLS